MTTPPLARDTRFDNTVNGTDKDEVLYGGWGNDRVFGGMGKDTIYGEFPPNHQPVMQIPDTDVGYDDYLVGGWQSDTIYGGIGNDTIYGDLPPSSGGLAVAAPLASWIGNDVLYGGEGNDFIDGGAGNDILLGDQGNDNLFGGAGNDRLRGGKGNDVLNGGHDADTLTGGAGKDVFQFNLKESGRDTVTDFTKGADKILISGIDALIGVKIDNIQGAINDYLKVKSVGADTLVTFDTNGKAAGGEVEVALLKNVHISQSDVSHHIQLMPSPVDGI